MYLLTIALRNLLRRRGRTFLIASILALAVIFFLFMESLMSGVMDITFSNLVDFETPHIEVATGKFFARADDDQVLPPGESFIPDETVLAEIRAVEGFSALTPVLDISADFAAGKYEFPVMVRAIDPGTFGEVFKTGDYLVGGDFIEGDEPGVVIGEQLAGVFDLEVGDSYVLHLHGQRGAPVKLQGQVAGIVSVPNPDMNLRVVLMAREPAASAIRLDEASANRIMVRLENRDQAVSQAEVLGRKMEGSGLEARSYREAAEFLVSLEAWGYLETYFILALFLLVGAIGIISVMVLAAIERVKEIGMMKAMGLTEGEIVRVFVLEAAGVGAIGGAIGCLLGAVVVFFMETYGISMEAFLDLGALGVPIADRIYGAWNAFSFVVIFVFVVVVAVAASLVPAYWAARKDPVDAIQHR